MSNAFSNLRVPYIILALIFGLFLVSCSKHPTTSRNDSTEYSAVLMCNKPISGSGDKMIAKFFVKGRNIREELFMPTFPEIILYRPDDKELWHILPRFKSYIVTKNVPYQPGEVLPYYFSADTVKRNGKVKPLETTQCGRYLCDKYSVVTTKKGKESTTNLWFAKKLGIAVKVEMTSPHLKTPTIFTLTDIQEKPLPDSLFKLPKGYKRYNNYQKMLKDNLSKMH